MRPVTHESLLYFMNMELPVCVQCPSCDRRVTMTAHDLLPKSVAGEMGAVAETARHMRCQCGHKGARTMVPRDLDEAQQFVRYQSDAQ